MSKKKSKPQKVKFNPITYLKTGSARKLAVYECLVPKNWEELKKFPVVFSRKHVNGNITFISVLIDLLCTGAKDVMFFVNESEEIYRTILDQYHDELDLEFEPVSYALLHNIIFESIAYAEDFGIAPHEDFRFAELILEEDNDDFPRLEIPLGQDGKALLLLSDEDPRADYFEGQIHKYGVPGTFEVIWNDFDFDSEEDYDLESCMDWEKEDWEDFFEEGDFEYLNYEIQLLLSMKILGLNYIKMEKEDFFAPIIEIQTTDEPISSKEYTKQQMRYQFEAYKQLESFDSLSNLKKKQLLDYIEAGLVKWPDNKVLYQYKWQYFELEGDISKCMKISLEMKEKFPSYLFSLTTEAQTWIELGVVDQIPSAMRHFTRIQEFLPDKKVFHLSELQAFYSPWIYYYSKNGEFPKAYFLMNFLITEGFHFDFPLHQTVQNAFDEEVKRISEEYLQRVEKGEVTKKEFLKMIGV